MVYHAYNRFAEDVVLVVFQTRHLANQKMKINTQYFLNVALQMLSGIKSAKLEACALRISRRKVLKICSSSSSKHVLLRLSSCLLNTIKTATNDCRIDVHTAGRNCSRLYPYA